ncbi:MAG: outer membrane protein transport protein [Deltaproteobacteria bacterium]|nr:outer membrane protein transport protein [Deltaproteobacteria bacterium]MCB9478343.1 outer membrane protein transport protein [Deltaproteobacteria bacterium]MCB9489327.1 outer membrane protein transport protein [Deltaproteobacteria bacterium]
MRRLLAGLTLFALLIPAAAWATPYDTFGTGARSIGMGMAYGAVGGDASAMHYNPATIVKASTFQLEFGYRVGDIALEMNDRQSDIDQDRGFTLGVVIGKTLLARQFRIGVNVYTPDDHFMRFYLPQRTAPVFLRYTNINHMQATITGGAFEIVPDIWSIGFGSSFVSSNTGGVDFLLSEDEGARGNLVTRLASKATPVIGTYVEPLEWLHFGLTYREKREQSLGLPNRIDLGNLKVFKDNGIIVFQEGLEILQVNSSTHFSPRQINLAMAVEPNDSFIWSLDATHYKYSEMKSNVAFSVANLTGDLGQVLPSDPPLLIPEPKTHDVWGVATGVEYKAIDNPKFQLHTRAGYNFRPTPVAEQTDVSNLLDSDTHIIGAGLGFTFADFSEVFPAPITLDIFNQFHYMEERTMRKHDPTNDFGDVKIGGYANSIGATFILRFN